FQPAKYRRHHALGRKSLCASSSRRGMSLGASKPSFSDSSQSEHTQGFVIRSQAGYQTVRTEKGDIQTRLRGRLRQGKAQGDLVAVGDNVRIAIHEDGTGSIEEVLPRKSV